MHPHQIHLVRSSWPIVAANADALTIHFYAHLFEIDDSAARLFAGIDMASQRKKLTQALAVVVKALDDPNQLLPTVAALGKRHTNYGVEHHHFDSVGEALIGALAAILGAEFVPEVQAAWTDAYALIASVMRRALIRAAVPPRTSTGQRSMCRTESGAATATLPEPPGTADRRADPTPTAGS